MPFRLNRSISCASDASEGSAEGLQAGTTNKKQKDGPLEPPKIIYHSSARSIVFRDQLRRATLTGEDLERIAGSESSASVESGPRIEEIRCGGSISSVDSRCSPSRSARFQPLIEPLPPLELGKDQEFEPLLRDEPNKNDWTPAEHDVAERFQNLTAVVKTIKNTEWHDFLQRFLTSKKQGRNCSHQHQDLFDDSSGFNSFVTSTSLLPRNGMKMRCYGSTTQYTIGVVFPLPTNFKNAEEEDAEVKGTKTWAWPSGYAAKVCVHAIREEDQSLSSHLETLTFCLDFPRLNLMLMAVAGLSMDEKRLFFPFQLCGLTTSKYSEKYLGNRSVALKTLTHSASLFSDYLNKTLIPYNEIYLRVGGKGRIVNGLDTASGERANPSYGKGVGLPIALFVRTHTYGHLIYLMRARARLQHVLGKEHIQGIPLLFITPTNGVRVFTESLQKELWKTASRSLNPFQNPHISYKTIGSNVDEKFVQQKMSELIDLDESIRGTLTPEEMSRLAGGFGATDDSVEQMLQHVMENDTDGDSHRLQDVVNEGLDYAVRSGDYYQARQLIILYSVVSARKSDVVVKRETRAAGSPSGDKLVRFLARSPDLHKTGLMDLVSGDMTTPPPPPLDTDRLRSATNSDGLLAVLGAAQILRVMKDGTAKKRVEEVISALEEWVEHGQQSVAFRISSWQKQRAAQGDLKINTNANSNFKAFAGKKAITNRKSFADRLRKAARATDFSDARFLLAIHEIIGNMHAPCLRLELLQYVLGLDNRFSVAHVGRSVELAATCLQMSATGSQ